MKAQTRIFDPKVVVAWFSTFFILFFSFIAFGLFIPALLAVVFFGSVFFGAYHLYMMLPGRIEENEEFMREWRKHLEERWAARPPLVRSVDYYVRSAPFNPQAAIGLLVALVLLLLIIALLTFYSQVLIHALL
jgi:hypothetical protein